MKKLVSLFGNENAMYKELNRRAAAYAKSRGMDYEWVPMERYSREQAIQALQNADAGVIDVEPYDRQVFSKICERNKLLIRFGVGYDAVNLEDATACGVKIARTQGANATGVAEYALLLILALRRKLFWADAAVRRGDWGKNVGHETLGATVGILGFGAVGQTFARLLTGFGCRVLGYDAYQNRKAAEELGVTFASPEEIFSECDAITVHLALNDDTRNFVNAERLALMKPGAVIANTARGSLVDDEALLCALREKRIGGAGLDVFGREPLAPDDPYLALDNVILSPHVASSTAESLWQIYEAAVDIAQNFFEGRDDPRMLN